MNQIRFLESHIDRNEAVQPFDIKDTAFTSRLKATIVLIQKKPPNILKEINFLIDEEDEVNQKVVKKIGKGATSVTFKVFDKRSSQVMY